MEAPEADEAAEAALDAELAALRAAIGAARHSMRLNRAELTALEKDLASCGTQPAYQQRSVDTEP